MSIRSPGSPQAAAAAWVDALMDGGDLTAVWPRTDSTLRLVLAQDWVWNHRDEPGVGPEDGWDELASSLAEEAPDHPLWHRFAADVVTSWQRAWRGFDTRTWNLSARPEVIDLDLEMVTFTEPGNPTRRRFAMRHASDGWLVASVDGDVAFEPGWPPRLGPRAGS